jgi:hypothetical protein
MVMFSLGLPTLWLTIVGFRKPRSPEEVNDLAIARVADQLASAVGIQWDAEARIRRLNDPCLLPVSWAAADPSLTDPWNELERLAGSDVAQPASPSAGTQATNPNDLAGTGEALVGVLDQVPTGRLVILVPHQATFARSTIRRSRSS